MKSRRDILKAHYTNLARKVAAWVGVLSLVATSFIAAPASAVGAQMGARSVTPTTLKATATAVDYAASFKVSATNSGASMKAILFEICDSPLETVGCAASGSGGVNSNGANLTGVTGALAGGGNCTGTWTAGTATGPGTSGTTRPYTNASGSPITTGDSCTFTLTGVTNPAGNNQHFYLRMTTYSDTGMTTELDFGGFALQTAQDLTVTASVQESLTFCAGQTVGTSCGTVTGGSISLATGSGCPILSTANVCTGTSEFAATTNANSGYSVSYLGTVFTGPNDTITKTGTSGATSSPGSKQFGLALTGNTGTGSGAGISQYLFSTASKYTYETGAPQQVATAASATAENVFQVTYAANVSPTTKPGQYTATIKYICTGLF